jgi:hypothetical protein
MFYLPVLTVRGFVMPTPINKAPTICEIIGRLHQNNILKNDFKNYVAETTHMKTTNGARLSAILELV